MHNPHHPGAFITEVYLEPHGLGGRDLAANLGVTASTLSRVLRGVSGISPDMALRLSIAVGRSPESWLSMQDNYDLWHAIQTIRSPESEAHAVHGSVNVSEKLNRRSY